LAELINYAVERGLSVDHDRFTALFAAQIGPTPRATLLGAHIAFWQSRQRGASPRTAANHWGVIDVVSTPNEASSVAMRLAATRTGMPLTSHHFATR
jgi:hypothetical protein